MATLRLTGCRVETNSIAISFSEKVDQTSATNVGNYAIFAPNSGFNTPGTPLPDSGANSWIASTLDDYTVYLSPKSQPSNDTFSPGDWVLITVEQVKTFDSSSAITSEQISGQAPGGAARATRDAEDLFTYPQLTEDYRPSPAGPQIGGGGGISGGGSLGQVALQAVSDVLGWRPSADPKPKEFLGALTQSFNLTEVRGQVKSTWVQRSYAVQTDLGGRISGAQASLYTRAKDALDQSLSLLDGLYPLDPDADPEYVKALREMARSQMVEIVKEFGTVGLPSILRIDTYFQILLGQHPSSQQPVQFDPDKIAGTLGELRDTYGIYFRGNTFNNSVADEEDITNFRVISDYMTSLMQSWIANRDFFIVSPGRIAFFGTQLVLIGRQFGSVADTVNEVRFALDSVFIGRNERQSLLLRFRDHALPAMFLEDMLVEIESFVTDEGPRLLRDGGKISVTNNILPVVRSYLHLVRQAHDPENKYKVPDGFRTARVRRTLDDLQDQLSELMQLVEQVEQELPPVTDKFQVTSIRPPSRSKTPLRSYRANKAIVSIFGGGFNPQSAVTMRRGSNVLTIINTEFYSDQRIDVTLDLSSVQVSPGGQPYDVEVKNAADEYVILSNGFTVTP
jgi:hypothetical protein